MAALRGCSLRLKTLCERLGEWRRPPRRDAHKKKWASFRPSVRGAELALQNLDMSCGPQLGDLWPSVRVGLLCEQKYGALLNGFEDVEKVIRQMELQQAKDFVYGGGDSQGPGSTPKAGCKPCEIQDLPQDLQMPESQDLQTSESCPDFLLAGGDSGRESPSSLETKQCLSVSPNLKCFTFPRGDTTRFKPARQGSLRMLEYYLMDAASLLPVLILNVQPGHTVLDLCAAPGGKTLALLQTECCRHLAINDISSSRLSRLRKILHNYVPKNLCTEDRLRITSFDGRLCGEIERDTFDRVLVDAPCTTDRHSVLEEDNNIFSRLRIKERQMLPLLQIQLLVSGILATKPGGSIVYSTCSLSQLQNECVVERAVQMAETEHGMELHPEDLTDVRTHYRETFNFYGRCRVGELVLPHLTANYGPMYFCKLHKIH
ncbi:5-methylcytosine rRNA methyltransferase NSUN4 [Amblyraja radiata]|uniref:5-methylcytosine rRNA methyltransferase NSUN4 n=1 Tax=Amblyraja radiata TaxID=386614 RepID=UPI001403CC9B|nr:5-methylcytosine rRNA methyltransferase NSUN4 [Amblyraja radiata]